MNTCARPSRFAVAALLAAMSSAASAQTSGTWITTTPDGNTGNWSDPAKWTATGVPNDGGNATFGEYANVRTVTVNDAVFSINKLTILPRNSSFSGQPFTLNSSGGGSLAIGAGGIDIGGGSTVSFNAPIEVTANQTWTALNNPAGSATFTGIISGIGKITRTSAGPSSVFRFDGPNTFSGGYEQTAANSPATVLGSSSTVTSGSLASGPLGTGTVTLLGGTLRSNDGTARTLHNNVVVSGTVNLGNVSQTGALTFSDAGLSTASTFTLGSSTNGAVTVLRTGNTALNIDQAIAESGGVGQSVLFASTSGTPTVTLNRTKTATGNLMTGGVNLVLNNGAANSGAVVAVNGSVTATGANQFSSSGLFSDGANVVATDLTNFGSVPVGGVTIYNNARLAFATAPTQAGLAALISEDSQFRLGLGSGSGPLTVAENYDQSALGNGRAGLVSATTGTLTYTGTLTAGSDNTYRVGGGLGTLALGSALTGANALSVEGGGTVTTSVNHTYSGATTLTGGTTTLTGANGALSGTSGITLNSGATLNIETGGTGNNRINNTAALTLNSGAIVFNSNAATTAFSETLGDFSANSGVNTLNFRTIPASGVRTVQMGALTRNNNSVLLVRGDSLGGTATNRNEIKFSAAPTLVGGGGAAGTANQSIVPWMRGAFDGNPSSGIGRFVTYDTNGLRTLSPVTEMVQANNNTTARIDQAIATAGGATTLNVRSLPSTTGGATLVNTASSTVTLNSLMFSNASATSANTYSLNTSTINITSGALHIQNEADQNLTLGSGTFAFGAAEANITTNARGFFSSLGTALTGSGGLSIHNLSGGGISLSGANNITGTFTFGGNGFVGVDNDARFGNAANSLVHAGGELRFFAGFTSTRGLSLLGNVGDNTLGNNNTAGQVVTWNGDISGPGRLRLINNNGANGTNGFNVGGANTHSGGTQIEGINVTASSNSALGTGTVTLQGANGNAAALNLTAAAPVIGGLRGTDGTVTINPTGSTATLTLGSNNENSVFNGVIAQGSGKTGSFTKVGDGNFVLGGTATYTGATTVSAGTYTLAGSIASSAVTVQSGARFALAGGSALGGVTIDSGANFTGTGTFGGASNVNGNFAVGNSPGVLTLADGASLAFGSTSVSTFEFTSASFGLDTFDRVVGTAGGASESVTFGGTLNLVFSGVGYGLGNNVAQIFDLSSISGSFTTVNVSGLEPTLTASFDSSTGFISITVIPEPSAFAALAGFGALGLAALRRRRRSA